MAPEGGGVIHGTPSVAAGVFVYAGAQDGKIYAFDAATGKPGWTFQTGESLFLSSPVIANGVVYVGNNTPSTHLTHGTGPNSGPSSRGT